MTTLDVSLVDARPVDVNWVDVCALVDIPLAGARVIERGDGRPDIAIFRTVGDRAFALDDRCPHKGGPLSQGIVHADRVSCPMHNWTIELASGEAVAPDVGCAHAIALQIVAGRVQIDSAVFG